MMRPPSLVRPLLRGAPRQLSTQTTHFGFQEVAKDDKKGMVKDVFDSVASSYDTMNDLMSGGMHRLWKDHFVKMSGVADLAAAGVAPKILDLAGGTGDIAFRFGRKMGARAFAAAESPGRLVVSDINEEMLAVGKDRAPGAVGGAIAEELEWKVVDAADIAFESDTFDLVTIAFGLRNVTEPQQALREVLRVLRPGGRFMCLEFTPAVTGHGAALDAALDSAYRAYSFNVIPRIGKMVADDADSYQYLVESIRRFPAPEKLAAMMREEGFAHVEHTPLPPGVVAVHSGFKF